MLNRINNSEVPSSCLKESGRPESANKDSLRLESVADSNRQPNNSFSIIREQMAPFKARDTIRVMKS